MNKNFRNGQLLLLLIVGFAAACAQRELPQADNPSSQTDTAILSGSHVTVIPQFSADSAYAFIEQQLRFGPRAPGSTGHRECRDFLVSSLQRWADTVWTQTFQWSVYGQRYTLSNIIARFNLDHPQRIWLTAHWDTRPFADKDPDPTRRSLPIPGANDGASGVAVLLELARLFAHHPPPVGIDIVLFDAEDMGYESDLDNFCIGSKFFAATLPIGKPLYAINLDMVGDHQARFYQEQYSIEAAPNLVHSLWAIGARLAPQHFIIELAPPIYDDHYSLIQVGIAAINIIDQTLIGHQDPNPRRHYWHTMADTIENINRETLKVVGQTLLHYLYQR